MERLNIWGLLLISFFNFLEVFIHEIGHYAAARYHGVTVLKVSISLVFSVFQWREPENGTMFVVKIFPLAGYDHFLTVQHVEGKHDPKADTITQHPKHVRIIIVLAGVAANMLFALATLLMGQFITDATLSQGCFMLFCLSLIDALTNLLPVKGLEARATASDAS